MATSEKTAAVAELTELFRTSTAAVLTEYRGLTVAELKQLRRALGENAHYAVVKNTLSEIAAKEAGIDAFAGKMSGPSAIAFVSGDPVDAAKAMRDFAKDHEALIVKGGYMDGQYLDDAAVKKLADLESREVLLAKLAGAMKGNLYKAAYMFQAPLSQAVRTVDALRAKVEEQGGAAAPAAENTEAAAEAAAE
ncbi:MULTISPECIES: 50S ribosomal protein L10 [Micrococcus]|uniref:Large ribosomal subunit protein uL10 n=1 Tax=Micrococcus terreus TaxID=574650 RepID=A0A1I7MDV9_9MICC|nr:50S ribosomal protein L10 [Micrococcus terreus]MCT2087712.1 50S ribosomal protein L10 [Micrococcus terreus]MDK7701829.1 50S ribosomal protein L10 [Micrococcus terreus]WOO96417.1 50S ribosomal protein L10 [Micrococcus terreus]SFV20097.1 LSU ribosomal protein L10P [Micrococcus terreus]